MVQLRLETLLQEAADLHPACKTTQPRGPGSAPSTHSLLHLCLPVSWGIFPRQAAAGSSSGTDSGGVAGSLHCWGTWVVAWAWEEQSLGPGFPPAAPQASSCQVPYSQGRESPPERHKCVQAQVSLAQPCPPFYLNQGTWAGAALWEWVRVRVRDGLLRVGSREAG